MNEIKHLNQFFVSMHATGNIYVFQILHMQMKTNFTNAGDENRARGLATKLVLVGRCSVGLGVYDQKASNIYRLSYAKYKGMLNKIFGHKFIFQYISSIFVHITTYINLYFLAKFSEHRCAPKRYRISI
jgi:hypothetical protein